MVAFGTAGIRGPVTAEVSPALAVQLGRALATEADEVVLGRDGRKTGSALLDAAAAGLQSGGASVRTLGVVPTPLLAYASRERYGLMITASHNPPADNGFKVFENGREITETAESRLISAIERNPKPLEWDTWGSRSTLSVDASYLDQLLESLIDTSVDTNGLSVVIDCGNGTAGRIVPSLLDRLGVAVTTINGTVDGSFSARPSKPTPTTIEVLRRYLQTATADCGIAYDGDADRIVLVHSDGTIVHEDTVLAVLARSYLQKQEVDDPVVITTPNASTRIDTVVNQAGGRVSRTPLGELRNGIDQVTEAGGDVVFAGEPWKHIHPPQGLWIDAIASTAVLVQAIARAGGIAPLREGIPEPPYRKASVACPDERKSSIMQDLEAVVSVEFPDATLARSHGLRLEWPDGDWVLVRPSGTEPKLRLYVEGERADARLAELQALLSERLSAISEVTPD